MIQKGTYVKVILTNGTNVEGYVQEWGQHATLYSNQSQNKLVIFNVLNNVILVKLILEKEVDDESSLPDEEQDTGQFPMPKRFEDPTQRGVTPSFPPHLYKESTPYEFPNFQKRGIINRSPKKKD